MRKGSNEQFWFSELAFFIKNNIWRIHGYIFIENVSPGLISKNKLMSKIKYVFHIELK